MPTATDALMHTDLPLPNRRQGKVRDLYDARTHDGHDALLIVATDRISAFDVVMANGIPGKGIILTRLSTFWFEQIARRFGQRLTHHLLSDDPSRVAGLSAEDAAALRGRVMIGRRCQVIPIECIVRGYLAGSGWKEYCEQGTVSGLELPPGLRRCERLPKPIFTPSTKAASGHDENISFARAVEIAGERLMTTLRDLSIELYRFAHDHAAERGIILADTKFEFGLPRQSPREDAKPVLIDEVLTPDSSRFWPADQHAVGRDQVSFDKQYVRNYLQELVDNGRWNKQPPGPALPDKVVLNTRAKYLEAYRALTERDLDL